MDVPLLLFLVLCFAFCQEWKTGGAVCFRGKNTRFHQQQTWNLVLALSLTSSGTPGKSLALSGSLLIYKTGWPGNMIRGQFHRENHWPKELKAGEGRKVIQFQEEDFGLWCRRPGCPREPVVISYFVLSPWHSLMGMAFPTAIIIHKFQMRF